MGFESPPTVEQSDETKLKGTVTQAEKDRTVTGTIIARPKGDKRAFNETAITTTAAYQKVCELTPADGKSFDLAYFACGCDKDIWIKLLWDGDVITPEIPVMALTMPQFWVPSEYKKVTGDGTKKFELQVKWVTEEGSAFGEIVGEET